MTPRCPQDQAPTELAANEGRVAWRCTACEGMWLPGVEVDAFARERSLDVAQFRAKLADGRLGDAPFACPGGHPLVRSEYRALELDWCPTCEGIWFDPGELRRLLDLHPNVFNRDNVGMLLAVIGVFLFAPGPADD
jgi:Zn-finger nucleic acid-binding protein